MEQIKTKTERLHALKAQLRFRQHILQQEADVKLFRHSEKSLNGNNRQDLSIEELTSNLLSLIKDATKQPEPTKTPFLVGKHVRHFFGDGDERKPSTGRVISTVPGFSMWFNIKYEEDEAIYTYKLLEDYEQGDLEIIVYVVEYLLVSKIRRVNSVITIT